MGATDRTVQHLRLRAPSAQLALRATHRLQDALRCASLPDAGERVLLVRRLALGRLPESMLSQSLSLLIEQRVAAVGGDWVHGGHEHAAHSDTVFFASHLQAAQAALGRRAQGLALTAWYWPLALPGVDVFAHPAAFLDQLVQRLGAQADALATLPALAVDAMEHGVAPWLLKHVDEHLARRWVDLAGSQRFLVTVPKPHGADAGGLPMPQSAGAGEQAEAQWVQRAFAETEPDWLAALLRAGGVRKRQWVASPVFPSAAGAPLARADRPGEMVACVPTERAAHEALAQRGALNLQCAPNIGPPVLDAQRNTNALQQRRCVFGDGLATEAGGLLFLLPWLERLDFAAWQAQHPDLPVCALILRHALQRMRVPVHDAAWVLVDSLSSPADEAPRAWSTPACWRDAAVCAGHAPAQVFTCGDAAQRWLIAARRQLRQHAGMGLAELCTRPAMVSWGRTHIEVYFGQNDADLRVRRLGLDLDPGWIVWLERVVVFVYGLPRGGR